MRLTPSEAATKRCQESYPAAQGISPDGHSFASGAVMTSPGYGASFAVHTAPMNCIGPRCMAWRWLRGEKNDDESEFLGFCGKAGPT